VLPEQGAKAALMVAAAVAATFLRHPGMGFVALKKDDAGGVAEFWPRPM